MQNMFQTLKYLVALGVFTFFTGNKMLRNIAKAKQYVKACKRFIYVACVVLVLRFNWLGGGSIRGGIVTPPPCFNTLSFLKMSGWNPEFILWLFFRLQGMIVEASGTVYFETQISGLLLGFNSLYMWYAILSIYCVWNAQRMYYFLTRVIYITYITECVMCHA